MRNLFLNTGMAIGLMFLAGCHHKDLVYGSAESKVIEVVFDWRDAPEASPESMALYLYPTDGSEALRYEFSGREGGSIRVPFGTYDALCINSDNTSWAHLTNTRGREAFGVSVGVLSESSDEDESTFAGVYRAGAKATDGLTVNEHPRGLWTGSADAFTVIASPVDQTLTLVPEDALCYYTVDIIDVKGLEDYSGSGIPALLTGMSDGVDALSRTSSTNPVSYPLILQPATRANSLHAEFTTFGEDTPANPVHQLHAMVEQTDGTWKLRSTDVTDQVHNAPDARHVHIIVRGFTLPHSSGGGLSADVDDWETENFTLHM